jgi:hypothetical protein
MKRTGKATNLVTPKEKIPTPIRDLIKVYERYQEAYAKTQLYLELVSPQTLQTNSSQSFVINK